MYELAHVTNSVLVAARKERIDITPMKLQKVLYFLYKQYYKTSGEALFSERFEAWKYGPALSDVYQAFKSYGSKPIKTFYPDSNGELRAIKIGTSTILDMAFILVWNACKGLSGIELSKLTHTKGSAWYRAYMQNERFISDVEICKEPDYLS